MNTPSLGGRPQSYVGAIEDRIVEMQSTAHELTVQDMAEWSAHAQIADLLSKIETSLAEDRPDLALHYTLRARGLHHTMRERDVEENRRHHMRHGKLPRGPIANNAKNPPVGTAGSPTPKGGHE